MAIQHTWKRCFKCGCLFYGSHVASSNCSAGGEHNGSMSEDYGLVHSITAGPGEQAGWRRCVKCEGLFYGPNQAASECPSGGYHKAALSPPPTKTHNYVVAHSGQASPGVETDWRWCPKCQALIHTAASLPCPSGGNHTPAGATYQLGFATCDGALPNGQPEVQDLVASVYDEFVSNQVNVTHGVAQAFTAPQSGTLQSFELHLERWNVFGMTPRVFVWKTAGGVPVATAATRLLFDTIGDFVGGNSPGPLWVTVPGAGITLVKGETYAIGVVAGGTQSPAPGSRGLKVYGKSGNPYPPGDMFDFSGPNALSTGVDFTTFTVHPGTDDMAFALNF